MNQGILEIRDTRVDSPSGVALSVLRWGHVFRGDIYLPVYKRSLSGMWLRTRTGALYLRTFHHYDLWPTDHVSHYVAYESAVLTAK